MEEMEISLTHSLRIMRIMISKNYWQRNIIEVRKLMFSDSWVYHWLGNALYAIEKLHKMALYLKCYQNNWEFYQILLKCDCNKYYV